MYFYSSILSCDELFLTENKQTHFLSYVGGKQSTMGIWHCKHQFVFSWGLFNWKVTISPSK